MISAGAPPPCRPRWGAYSAPPDPLAGFQKGPTSKGKGGEGRGGERGGKEGKGGGRGPISSVGPGPPKHVKTALTSQSHVHCTDDCDVHYGDDKNIVEGKTHKKNV